MLKPNQFNVNDAWLVFRLNDGPINTEQDGSFNAVSLMDAASCFILATTMVPAQCNEPSELEAKRLFKTARGHSQQFPAKLLVPAGEFETLVRAQAERHGVTVIAVPQGELSAFTDEASKGFEEHVQQAREQ